MSKEKTLQLLAVLLQGISLITLAKFYANETVLFLVWMWDTIGPTAYILTMQLAYLLTLQLAIVTTELESSFRFEMINSFRNNAVFAAGIGFLGTILGLYQALHMGEDLQGASQALMSTLLGSAAMYYALWRYPATEDNHNDH